MARTVYDEMLVGASDLHVHVDLEFSRTAFRKALPEWEWLPRAERAGMRAVLLKSHLWPSVTVAALLEQVYAGPVQVATSVTLNPTTGGVDPWAVEAAAAMGARAVFMPTWGSANDRARGGSTSGWPRRSRPSTRPGCRPRRSSTTTARSSARPRRYCGWPTSAT